MFSGNTPITGISLLEPGTSLNVRMSRSQRCLLLACLDHKDVCYLYYGVIPLKNSP